MVKNVFKPLRGYNNKKGFAVVEVIVVVIVIIIIAAIAYSIFGPSVPKDAAVSYKSITLNGSFTTVPTTITTKPMIVKFTLTNATGAPIKDRMVTFKLTNMADSKFTNRKGRKVKTNKNGIANTSIRAKKHRTGDGTITASIIYKTAAGKWGMATEESKVFEIDGTN